MRMRSVRPPISDVSTPPLDRDDGEYFPEVVARRFARRRFVQGLGAAGAGLVVAPVALGSSSARAASDPGLHLSFDPIAPSGADAIVVPDGYAADVLVAWGDPLFPGAPAFSLAGQNADDQARQFGFNSDFVAQFPVPEWLALEVRVRGRPSLASLTALGIEFPRVRTRPSRRALLWNNHEYTTGVDMFPGYSSANPTAEQVEIELAAHGASVVGIIADGAGRWTREHGSRFNRRITGTTEIALSGPVAGHPLVQTSDDPGGTTVLGMLNNCGGGITPWGTVLTAEENFDQYFANRAGLAAIDPAKVALYARLPAPSGASDRKWERFFPRFDLAEEPNEYARFGWVVEVDPYDPTAQPRKRTALGRFKHEAAVPAITRAGRVAIYSGDDARFEYVYKFVSHGKYNRFDRRANLGLLDHGTLYVAKFLDDGTGRWLPLRAGEGPLTAANGFPSQVEVLIDARRAGDLLGATKMDRPEDIEVSPTTGKVYVALTNNSSRTAVAADPGEVAANPRLNNRWGHVIEIVEDHDDAGATSFHWEIFMLCGDTAAGHATYFAGFDATQVSPISCPDNLDFDAHGNLWIATDGAPATPGFSGRNDGIFAVPVEGSDRGNLRQFLSGAAGCEVASLEHSTDGKTLFASIQHPGEGLGLPNPQSSWPDGSNEPPRPAVIAVRSLDGSPIGR